jgi:hypothetical protein
MGRTRFGNKKRSSRYFLKLPQNSDLPLFSLSLDKALFAFD